MCEYFNYILRMFIKNPVPGFLYASHGSFFLEGIAQIYLRPPKTACIYLIVSILRTLLATYNRTYDRHSVSLVQGCSRFKVVQYGSEGKSIRFLNGALHLGVIICFSFYKGYGALHLRVY